MLMLEYPDEVNARLRGLMDDALALYREPG
jgi:hypothetical protein